MHPQPRLPFPSPPPRTPTATEGAQSCTFDPLYPVPRSPLPTYPPPKAHNRAPPTPITPPPSPNRYSNRHRGSTTVHPRPEFVGARPGLRRQPAPKAHNRAPSTPIRQGKPRTSKGNPHSRRKITYPQPPKKREAQQKSSKQTHRNARVCARTVAAAKRHP